MSRLAALTVFFCVVLASASAADLFDGFSPSWRDRWREEKFFTTPTRYDVVADADTHRPVLHATSDAAHAGLLRSVTLPAPSAARLTWRWKILAPLTGNTHERERAGDDYAARVFVVFETSVLPLRTRAINYVWSAHEPVGSVFPSPYTKYVAMIVVRSGPAGTGRWLAETRDVLADYRQFFGAPPSQLSAVAVLVDTDNTHRSAEAWFADLSLETTPPFTLLTP